MNNSRKKYVEIIEKTGSDEICALLDEVESNLDEDVDNEMNDSDTEFSGNDELDYNAGSVANASNILVPVANVHSYHLEALLLIVQLVLKTSQPPGDEKALANQVKKYNVSLQQTYYYIFLVIRGRLMSLRKPLI